VAEKCVFLDRDGVINRERGDYTYKVEDFEIIKGVFEALKVLKNRRYLIIVITNQAGISRGIFTRKDMKECHLYMQKQLDYMIDDLFYCPYHPDQTASLGRKPDSLLFERAMAKYHIDHAASWMAGDKERDLIPAKKTGLKTILISNDMESDYADYNAPDLITAAKEIINKP